jgi:hypothetical protein
MRQRIKTAVFAVGVLACLLSASGCIGLAPLIGMAGAGSAGYLWGKGASHADTRAEPGAESVPAERSR